MPNSPILKSLLLLALLLPACQNPASPAPAAPRPSSVKVAAIQFRSTFAAPSDNRKRLVPYIRAAAQNGAKIIVLPEAAITGYTSEDLRQTWQIPGRAIEPHFTGVNPLASAETVPGPSTQSLAQLAAELHIYLTVPLVERAGPPDSPQYFNTIVLLDPTGKIALHYRKLNPWPYAEIGWATKGDRGLQTLDTPYGRLALLVCFDINFEPPNLRALKADTLLYCIAWVDDENSAWFYDQLPAIAKQNNLNIIGANWTIARHTDWFGYGHSLIITNQGQVLTRAADDLKEEILYADLPLQQPQ